MMPAPVAADKPAAGTRPMWPGEKTQEGLRRFRSDAGFSTFQNHEEIGCQNGISETFQGQETYEMMMDQKIAEEMANKGGMGLQKMLYNQMVQRCQKKD